MAPLGLRILPSFSGGQEGQQAGTGTAPCQASPGGRTDREPA